MATATAASIKTTTTSTVAVAAKVFARIQKKNTKKKSLYNLNSYTQTIKYHTKIKLAENGMVWKAVQRKHMFIITVPHNDTSR